MECLTCLSLAGVKPVSPAPRIYEGQFWVVEHAYPCDLQGWLVLVLRRHAAALHELTADEWRELTELQARSAIALRTHTGCAKEYIACFAEKPGFNHVHVHIIARPEDLSDSRKGPAIFDALRATPEQSISVADLSAFCLELQADFATK
jgi:diadenosine tetraphosphate (Ap4A) HIT family hydrolase